MSDIAPATSGPSRRTAVWLVAALAVAGAGLLFPDEALATTGFVLRSLLSVAPLVVPGILLSSWVRASGASAHIADTFSGRLGRTILLASAVGAVTPVCGISVLPLMIGLLASGVPLAPVMAFWLSSPVTDPAMLATTAATLGVDYAIGKTLSAFCLGLLGGGVTAALCHFSWCRDPLRQNRIVGRLCSICGPEGLRLAIWRSREHRRYFLRDVAATARLILICLIPAFAAEHVLGGLLEPEALAAYVGIGNWWAVPAAVLVGAPLYLDGFAALPLTRAMVDHGMAPGAALGFLVSGGVVSIYGAMAILPVLKLRPFLLFLGLAVTGSLAAGWIFGLFA